MSNAVILDIPYDHDNTPTASYATQIEELDALTEAFNEVSGVEPPPKPKVDDTRTQEELLSDPRNMIY